jgi:hypothetical protein
MKEKRLIIFLIFLSVVAYKGYAQDVSSIEKNDKEALIYPNPLIGDKFFVRSESAIVKVELVNVIGKVINRTENLDKDLRELQVFVGNCEKGMYFVKITFDNKKSIIKKLLVK